jgi:hypothetical protein
LMSFAMSAIFTPGGGDTARRHGAA